MCYSTLVPHLRHLFYCCECRLPAYGPFVARTDRLTTRWVSHAAYTLLRWVIHVFSFPGLFRFPSHLYTSLGSLGSMFWRNMFNCHYIWCRGSMYECDSMIGIHLFESTPRSSLQTDTDSVQLFFSGYIYVLGHEGWWSS